MSINLTLLRSFHAVVREGSFTAAAGTLRVTQPTLTSQVQAIERDHGVELFLRRRPPLVLSPLGHALYEIAQRLFLAQREAEALVTEGRELRTGELGVGSVSPHHVADMLALFHKRYPGIYVRASITNSNRITDDLLGYKLDIAVLSQVHPDARFISIPYRTDPLVIFAHRHHHLASRGAIRIEELEGEPMVLRENGSRTRSIFEEALLQAGVRVRVVMEVQGREALRAMVVRGVGLGIMSLGVYEHHPMLCFLHLKDVDLTMRTFVVFMRNRGRSSVIRAFLDTISAHGCDQLAEFVHTAVPLEAQ